jgi:parallel beta-helix repeat protein
VVLVERRALLASLAALGASHLACSPVRAFAPAAAPAGDAEPLYFTNLTSLRRVRAREAGAIAFVAGYGVPGDGGAGVFRWDAAATAADDDGTVIAPAEGREAALPGRWRRADGPGYVSIAWFGAVPHDRSAAAKNSRAIQRAIDVAQAAPGPERATVRIPHGTFFVDRPLTLSSVPLSIRGEGMGESSLSAVPNAQIGARDAMVSFADGGQNTRFELTELSLWGASVAGYGIRSARADHTLIRRVAVRATLKAGITLGYGWSNSIQNCEISYNRGDGLTLTSSSNNDVTVSGNKIFANDGIGVKVLGGAAVNIVENGLEQNRVCAVYLFAVLGARVTGNYFEQNGEIGMAFTSPRELVRADIIVNGSATEGTMGPTYQSSGLEIAHCYAVSRVPEGVFVWLGGASPVRLAGNVAAKDMVRRPLIGCMAERTLSYSSQITMESNSGFSPDYAIRDGGRGATIDVASWSRDDVPSANHATDDVFRFARLLASQGGVIQRHGRRRAGCEVMEITGAVHSDIWGFAVDLAGAPELAGRWVYFAVEAATTSPRTNLRVAIHGGAGWIFDTDSESGTTGWSVRQIAVRAPASGVLQVGVGKLAGVAADSVFFTRPVLAAVGAPFAHFYREPRAPRWVSPRPPERGAWSPGDLISDPAPRSESAIGWICVHGGSPGVWKPLGNAARGR